MTTAIDRKSVTERRRLSFSSMRDIAADVYGLGDDVRTTANWTAAQVLGHVTFFITGSLDGIDVPVPIHFKLLGKLFKRGATSKTMNPGFNMPKAMATKALPSADLSWSDAVEDFREAMRRIDNGERMTKPSPVFGPMSHEEWERLHCRHAEMHFSFIHPVEAG
jgi:hypothetical protein